MLLRTKRTVEPVTTDFLSTDDGIQYLKIPTPVSANERNLVADSIDAAFSIAERDTDRAIRPQTWKMYLDAFPCRRFLEIPYAPLVAVTSITYTKSDGTSGTVAGSVYEVDNISEPGRILLADAQSWPTDAKTKVNNVVIEYTCGYESIGKIPAALKMAILQLATHFYDSRNPVVVGAGGLQAVEVPKSFEWVFEKWRIRDFHCYVTGR